ncbi:MAG: hypothetical protein IPM84_21045 [Anaerolineae bacterium]|nr:hypothetical protein [Anaerolineae bacterium]
MFDAKSLMFIYVETSLHVKAPRSPGTVYLSYPARSTGYLMVQASSLKGEPPLRPVWSVVAGG